MDLLVSNVCCVCCVCVCVVCVCVCVSVRVEREFVEVHEELVVGPGEAETSANKVR